jgi:hypothetical protein
MIQQPDDVDFGVENLFLVANGSGLKTAFNSAQAIALCVPVSD